MKAARIALVVFLSCAACASNSTPVEIPASELPFDVARQPPETESPSAPSTFVLYFLRGNRLVEVSRRIEPEPRPVIAVLRTLLRGPTARERSRRIVTHIPSPVRVLDVTVEGRAAHVDLSGEFQQPAAPEVVVRRVAQVVWTVTAIEDIEFAVFSIDGEPVDVGTERGELKRRVARSDYEGLSPG